MCKKKSCIDGKCEKIAEGNCSRMVEDGWTPLSGITKGRALLKIGYLPELSYPTDQLSIANPDQLIDMLLMHNMNDYAKRNSMPSFDDQKEDNDTVNVFIFKKYTMMKSQFKSQYHFVVKIEKSGDGEEDEDDQFFQYCLPSASEFCSRTYIKLLCVCYKHNNGLKCNSSLALPFTIAQNIALFVDQPIPLPVINGVHLHESCIHSSPYLSRDIGKNINFDLWRADRNLYKRLIKYLFHAKKKPIYEQ